MSLPILQSGQFSPGSNTPSGTQFQYPVDAQYISKASYILTPQAKGLGITAASADGLYLSGELNNILLRASSQVNRICGRYFNVQSVDEQGFRFTVRPYNPELVHVNLLNMPYWHVNSIWIQVLKWFIPIDISSTGYVIDAYGYGFVKIVPLLSNAGAGTGSPIPAEIIDRAPLGVLWINYTFGYGAPLTAIPLTEVTSGLVYQAPTGYQLWAPPQTNYSQVTNVYVNAVLQTPATYTVSYPDGLITFTTTIGAGKTVTADFTTCETIPQDIRQAVILLASDMISQGLQNPLFANDLSMVSYSVSFSDKALESATKLLKPYVKNNFKII